MVKNIFIILFAVNFSVHHLAAQLLFYKKFQGFTSAYPKFTSLTNDGGWITGGTADTAVKLMKFDKYGNLEWNKNYASPQTITCSNLVACAQGGYALAGYSGPYPSGNCDPYLLKLDSSGNVLFCKQYQGPTYEHVYNMGEDSHGNFLISGNCANNTAPPGNNFTLKTDANGNLLWAKLYGESGTVGYSTVCKDGGVIRCHRFREIYKTDSNGVMQWAKHIEWPGLVVMNAPIEVNGGYVFASFKAGKHSLLKIDFNGNYLWNTVQYPAGSSVSEFQKFTTRSNGNILSASNHLIMEFDSSGNYVNHQKYAQGGPWYGYSVGLTDICRLPNDFLVITGWSSSLFVAQINAQLHSACIDMENPLDTFPKAWVSITDTVLPNYSYSFTPYDLPITVSDLNPNEEIFCSEYDSTHVSEATAISQAENKTNDAGFAIFPNPGKGQFTLQLHKEIKSTIHSTDMIYIFNSIGTCVFRQQFQNSENQQIDISKLSRGIYFVEVEYAGGRLNKKLVLD